MATLGTGKRNFVTCFLFPPRKKSRLTDALKTSLSNARRRILFSVIFEALAEKMVACSQAKTFRKTFQKIFFIHLLKLTKNGFGREKGEPRNFHRFWTKVAGKEEKGDKFLLLFLPTGFYAYFVK